MAKKETQTDVLAKAEQLSVKHGVKVHAIIFKDNGQESGNDVIGFIKEPSRLSKYRFLDKAMTGTMSAAAELLEVCLIKEESDPRIYVEASENDKFNIGAATECAALLNFSTNTLKKS